MVALATKSDMVDRQRLAEHLIAIDQLGDWADIVPVLGDPRRPGRGGRDGALRAPAALAGAALPRRRAHRRARARHDRRAGPRGRARGRARRAAAQPGRRRRRDRAARGPQRGQAAARRAGQRVRRARLAEGHRHRPRRRHACARSAPTRAPASRRCSASGCTSTCTSRWPRTGSATPSSSAASASEPRRRSGGGAGGWRGWRCTIGMPRPGRRLRRRGGVGGVRRTCCDALRRAHPLLAPMMVG